jgi:hypothetical protein
MAKTPQKPPTRDDKLKSSINYQSYQYEQQGEVSKAMMSAGPGRNRLAAGMKAAWNARTQSPFGKGGPKTIGGTALRLFGKQTAAMWYDRLLAYDTRASKARREKKEGKDDDGSQVAAAAFSGVGESLGKIQKVLNLHSAALISIGRDVGNIKTMMMPKFFNVKIGKKAGNQGIAYSPMAPEGQQIKLTENGKITSITPGSRFKDKAVEKAAMITARLALKIDKQDQAKSALKRKFTEPAERNRFAKDPFAALSESLADLKEQNEEILENQEEAKGGMFSKIGDFLQDWWAFSPFLGFFKTFAKLGLLGLSLYVGAKIGEWLYDKFGTQMLDAIFWVKDKWNQLSDWFNNFSLEEFFLPLTAAIRKVTDFLHITKSDEEYKAEEKKNAAAGRTRGAIASSKGMSVDASIAHYDKLSKDKSLTPEAREANAKARDALTGSQMRTSDGVSTYIATPESVARTGPQRGRKQVTAGPSGTIGKKTAPGDLPMPGDDVKSYILHASKLVGVDPGIMMAVAKQESSFNPSAIPIDKKTGKPLSSAKGLYQFINSTWGDMVSKYGSKYPQLAKGPMDPLASAIAGALFIKENSDYLKKKGIPVTGTSIYAAHFLGAGGAAKLFGTDGNMIAADVMPAAAKSNPHIFFKGGKAKTIEEVQETLFNKVGKYADQYSAALAAESGEVLMASATSVAPAPPMSASRVEGDSRALSASKEGPMQVAMVAPTTVNNTTNTTKTPPRPLPKAKAVSSDDSFVRNTASATVHPTSA